MNAPARRAAALAFSLIEVLIAVIILGLGLLGLGAVFPVVLRQQRIAGDAVNGQAAAASVVAQLAATSGSLARALESDDARAIGPWRLLLGYPPNPSAGPSGDRRGLGRGWDDSSADGDRQQFEFGQWWIPEVRTEGDQSLLGALTLGLPGGGADEQARIALPQRFFPADPRLAPTYVADVAVQRKTDLNLTTGPDDDDLRVAVFIRRVDPRIRVERGRTLREVLLSDRVPSAQRRSPVGADRDGLPTLDGSDGRGGYAYAHPMTASVRGDSADRGNWWRHFPAAFEVVRLDDAERYPERRRFLSNINTRQMPGTVLALPGQKLVDNLGTIYTVDFAEPDPDNPNRSRVRISPELSLEALRLARDGNFEVVFTPQIPAAVELLELPR